MPNHLHRAAVAILAPTLAALTLLNGGAATADASGGTPAPQTDDLKQVSALTQPSVVYLVGTAKALVYDKTLHGYLNHGREITAQWSCTGFVVNSDGWIATAGHCVDPTEAKLALTTTAAQWAIDQGYYSSDWTAEDLAKTGNFGTATYDREHGWRPHHFDETVTAAWSGAVSGVDIVKNKPASIEGYRSHDLGDAALVKVDETGLNALPIAQAGTEMEINDSVVSIGYPALIQGYTDPDLVPTFNNGTISSLKTVGHRLLNVYQTTSDLEGGMSGGPTVDAEGNVVGINVAEYQGTSFNYSFPSDQIRQLMSSTGVANELTDTTKQYRSGIEAYFAGDKDAAVADLEAVVEDQPANGVAADYLKRAKNLPEPSDSFVATWLWWILGAAAGLLVLVASLLVALAVRRGRPAAHGPSHSPMEPPMVASQPHTQLVGAAAGTAPLASTPPPPAAPAAPAGPVDRDRTVWAGTTPPPRRFCAACGTPSSAGHQFCSSCGSPQ